MNLRYIYHSGFILETEKSYLVFDYFKGDIPKLDKDKKVYVFSSHFHRDHFTKKIFEIFGKYDAEYVLSDDILYRPEKEYDVHYVSPNSTYEIDDMKIETLRSTDEGVAFIIGIEGKTIYHAGDLNWWTWHGYETEEEYENMTAAFKSEMEKIKGRFFNLAMVPLDPRQGDRYDWGMKYFIENTETEVIAPMHCWNKYEVIDRFIRDNPEIVKDVDIVKINEIDSHGYEI